MKRPKGHKYDDVEVIGRAFYMKRTCERDKREKLHKFFD